MNIRHIMLTKLNLKSEPSGRRARKIFEKEMISQTIVASFPLAPKVHRVVHVRQCRPIMYLDLHLTPKKKKSQISLNPVSFNLRRL